MQDQYSDLGSLGKNVVKDAINRISETPNDPYAKLGKITREQWDYYLNTYLPLDKIRIEAATGGADNREAEAQARTNTLGAFKVAKQSADLQQAGLGLMRTPEERRYINARHERDQTAALTQNVNNARLHARDRDTQILTGGMGAGLRDIEAPIR